MHAASNALYLTGRTPSDLTNLSENMSIIYSLM
jgi:hypothetical protein